MPPIDLTDPIVKYGFPGMVSVLLAVLVWLIGQLLKVIRQTNKAISAHTIAVMELANQIGQGTEQCKDQGEQTRNAIEYRWPHLQPARMPRDVEGGA